MSDGNKSLEQLDEEERARLARMAEAGAFEQTTLAAYAQRLKDGRDLTHVPQPYGRSVADYIRANRGAGLPDMCDFPELIAHLLHDLDTCKGKK